MSLFITISSSLLLIYVFIIIWMLFFFNMFIEIYKMLLFSKNSEIFLISYLSDRNLYVIIKKSWTLSSVGQSIRLITGRSMVRVHQGPPFLFAGMAELADALDLGSSVPDVQVQLLLPAPIDINSVLIENNKLLTSNSQLFVQNINFHI